MRTLYDPKRNDPASIAEFVVNCKGIALMVQGDGTEEIIVPLNDTQREMIIDALVAHAARLLATV